MVLSLRRWDSRLLCRTTVEGSADRDALGFGLRLGATTTDVVSCLGYDRERCNKYLK